jgi:hypothetical protein
MALCICIDRHGRQCESDDATPTDFYFAMDPDREESVLVCDQHRLSVIEFARTLGASCYGEGGRAGWLAIVRDLREGGNAVK